MTEIEGGLFWLGHAGDDRFRQREASHSLRSGLRDRRVRQQSSVSGVIRDGGYTIFAGGCGGWD